MAGVCFVAIVCICYYIFVIKSKKAIGFTVGGILATVICVIILFNSNAVIIQKVKIIADALKNGQELTETASFYEDVEIDGMVGKVITKDGEYAIDYAKEASQFMHNGQVLNPTNEEPMVMVLSMYLQSLILNGIYIFTM